MAANPKAHNLPLVTITEQMAQDVVGIYQVAPHVLIHIRYQDDILTGQVTGQARQVLYTLSENTYQVGNTKDQVRFSEPLLGKFQQLNVIQHTVTTARRLPLVPSVQHQAYTGRYYSSEQQAHYYFYSKNDHLWFTAGKNPSIKADILAGENRIYLAYKDLEQATLDFTSNEHGAITGFVLNSGRVKAIAFNKDNVK